MRILLTVVGAIAVSVTTIGRAAGTYSPSPPARHLVIAELFTSEGCSSCPPADALLQQIAEQSPVEGVQVLGIEEHVDYWDHLGWRDRFSSAAFTRRQSDYAARVFRFGEVYTPQLVVDGAFEAVGSDGRRVRDAIARAAALPAADLRIAATQDGGRAHVRAAVDVPDTVRRRGDASVIVAVVEDALASRVDGGENRGRTLSHAAVARSLNAIGSLSERQSSGTVTGDVPLDPAWDLSRVRVVAFLQERGTLRVLGSAASPLTR